MRKIFIWLFLLCIITETNAQQWIQIQEQKFDLKEKLGLSSSSIIDVESFYISDFVTLKEYKFYLQAIKEDSTIAFYHSQLPDTTVFGSIEDYQNYITTNTYDNMPVVGISWDNAMSYCKWKTQQSQEAVLFRLPTASEWIVAIDQFKDSHYTNIFSDWLLNSSYNWGQNYGTCIKDSYCLEMLKENYIYLHKKEDPMIYKRKMIAGNSWYYQSKHPLIQPYYCAFEGYRFIAFRIVKEEYDKNNLTETQSKILKYWSNNE